MNTDTNNKNVDRNPLLDRTGDHFNPLAGTNDTKKPHSSLFGNFGRNPNVATPADGINTVVGGATAAQTGHEHHHGLTSNAGNQASTTGVGKAPAAGVGAAVGGAGVGTGVGAGGSGRPAGMTDAEYQAGYQKALDEARSAQSGGQQQYQAPTSTPPSTNANQYKEGYETGAPSHGTHDHASHTHPHSTTSTTGGTSKIDAIENKGEKVLGGTGLHHDSNHPGHGGPDEVVAGNFGGAGGVQDEKLLKQKTNVVYEHK